MGRILSISKKLKKFVGLMKNYDEKSNQGYIFEVDIEYPKNLHDLHCDLTFLPERMKINKWNKLVCNLHDQKINKKLCCSHKSFRTRIKSWINTKKST